jgi:hypothetical protein
MKMNYPSMTGKKSKSPRNEEDTEDYLYDKWGYDYDENLKKAQQLLQDFGTDEFIEYLENSGLGNYAPLVESLHEVAVNREKAFKNLADNPLQYHSMAKAEVHNKNIETREALNRAFSNAKDSYVKEHGNIDTAIPQTDLFKVS